MDSPDDGLAETTTIAGMSLPQRYGDFATWTGSIGTVLAFGVGFYGIHKARRHRLRREVADRLHARREHADRVSAWFAGSEIVVANESGHPIHDVVLTYAAAPHSPCPPHSPREGAANGGPEQQVQLRSAVPGETRLDAPLPPNVQIPTLLFTDARGDRWRRDPGKPPTAHTEEPPRRGPDPR